MRNTNITRRIALTSFVFAVAAIISTTAFAQSSRKHRMSENSHSRMANRSSQKMEAEIGLEGYCPVCIIKHEKWVKGKAEHSASYDGVTYYFPSDQVKRTFQQSPAQYVPALGGDCTVCYAKAGKRVDGNIRFASVSNERLFLFPSEKERGMFNESPTQYTDVDLAIAGKCIVCKVKAGKIVDGKERFTHVHDGFRYLFPSESERRVFAASPAAFITAEKSMKKESKMGGDAKKMTDVSMIRIEGKTACAACEFGVTPVGAPQELGLAVKTANGQVYVIEEGHTRWPQLYKDRFEGKRVAVSGDIIKSKGNISWIKPSNLKTF